MSWLVCEILLFLSVVEVFSVVQIIFQMLTWISTLNVLSIAMFVWSAGAFYRESLFAKHNHNFSEHEVDFLLKDAENKLSYEVFETLLAFSTNFFFALAGPHCQIDIPRTVQMIREQRSGMVQTEQQYRFLYQAVSQYMKMVNSRLDAEVIAFFCFYLFIWPSWLNSCFGSTSAESVTFGYLRRTAEKFCPWRSPSK